jgi:uncharacterized RDD family membrane protein YckC
MPVKGREKQEHGRAGLWRRLGAAWIDMFVIYAVAETLIAVTATTRIRLALEPVFVMLAAAYGTVMIARWGQTVGKMLLGVTVTMRAGGGLTLWAALIREALGKWGIGVVIPLAAGRALVGRAWVPTVYDVPVLLSLALLLLVQTFVAKRAWYDLLAGTVPERAPGASGLARPAFIALMGAAVVGFGTTAAEFAAYGRAPGRLSMFRSMRSTKPYASFLEEGQATPVDYVIGLFDRYDVVVLCERLHPEGSQWEFICEVLADPRFGERVGHVFTEYGQAGMQGYLDSFMAADGLDAREIHDRAVHLLRNWSVWPTWTNTNVYTYLTRLYTLNQSRPVDRRIHPHFTDVSVDWSGMTADGYRAFWRSLGNRDEQMARRVIEEMGRLAESAHAPPKCLVVMNYRHAFDLTGGSDDAPRRNTYEYLKDAFGGRAANVLINTRIVLYAPIAGGIWDAAFEETGHPPAGFDFEGSPFGEDPFDMFPFLPKIRGEFRYQDVFTGLVFAHPLDDQYLGKGVPGYYKGFEAEALRRAGLVSENYVRAVEIGIEEEKAGRGPAKTELPGRRYESLVELYMLVLSSVGLLIGVGTRCVGRAAR